MEKEMEIEKQLLAHGFTEKDIHKLKRVIEEGKKHQENETLLSLVQDLKKRFVSGCYCILLILLIYPFAIDKNNGYEILSYIIVASISLAMVYFIIPMRLAFKAYVFLKKQR